jgi:acetylglutamate kinase
LSDPSNSDSLISTLKAQEIPVLIQKDVIQGGMIPKVNACLEGLNGGVPKAHIIDARLRHALLLEIFTDQGIGTQILK